MDQFKFDEIDPEEYHDDLRDLERELAPSSTDYYGILNISRNATNEEIKEAYNKLSRFFHPDKQSDASKKKMAESKFQVIQKAYEALSDPQQREIYNVYGEKGLNATKEVGPRYKTVEQLREEYEKKSRELLEDDLESLVRSKGELHITWNATPIFDSYEPPVFAGFGQSLPPAKKKNPLEKLAKTQVSQLFMSHSFQTQLGPQTYAILGGSMVTRTGMGGGNLLGTIRHTVSPKLWGEVTATILHPRMLTLKSYYTIDSESFVNTTAQLSSLHEPPVLSVKLGRKLSTNTTGYLKYRTGAWSILGWGDDDISEKLDRSSVSLGLTGSSTNKNSNYSSEVQTGIVSSRIAGAYSYKLTQQGRLRVSCSFSFQNGIMTSIGSEHKISQYIRAGMSMECGMNTGVIIKFRISRLGQKAVLPIILSSELDLKLAFFGAFIPASVAIIFDQFILKPRRKRLIQQKIEELREQHADYLETRKQEAIDAQALMSDIAERKKRQEEKKSDGLVIVKAWYGNLEKLDKNIEDDDEVIDVTTVIQTFVNDSRLTIPGGHSKTNILGFYDPCLGEKKKLRVQYRYENRLHQVTVDDTEPLSSPVQAHVV